MEDAIVLGCDAVNLSLGTSNAGFSRSMAYEEILDRIVESDTLVTVSMGNAGGWADYALSGVPYLYGDDVSLSTGGSPASYTNGLSVAAVDNGGYTGQYLAVGEDLLFYMEATDYGNA
ncbi:MAG: S8 family serine peptidase, partial [Oscillospiraceae bacterium]|nr:S8 family serine peptidase [Oscillospiraceae bacterium]